MAMAALSSFGALLLLIVVAHSFVVLPKQQRLIRSTVLWADSDNKTAVNWGDVDALETAEQEVAGANYGVLDEEEVEAQDEDEEEDLEVEEMEVEMQENGDNEHLAQEAVVSEPVVPEPPAPAPASSRNIKENLSFLQTLGAITGRGEFASKDQRASAAKVVAELEAVNPTKSPTRQAAMIQGRWDLVYSSTELFRSSPFFMAGREVCRTEREAQQYNWFCTMHRKALAISTITGVRQVVSDTRLVSEFEVKAGAIPFLSDFTPFKYSGGLPVTIDGSIVSSADLTPLADGSGWELYLDTVEIKGSNLPGVRQVLDNGLKLESRRLGDFLEKSVADYRNPRPVFSTTFLNDQFRISRDVDGHVFCYVKTSEDPTPTDYSAIDADLGVLRLLEGFNDAITRFYI